MSRLEERQLFKAILEDIPIEIIADLINKGASVNCEDKIGMKPLALAAMLAIPIYADICRYLINNGARINAPSTERGLSAIMFSARNGKVETCRLLIARGSWLSLQDKAGDTALHWCAFTGQLGVARLLLENGVDRTVKDINGMTALDLAKAKGFLDIVALLEKVVHPKPIIVGTVADPHKRRREDVRGDSAEIQGLVEKTASAEGANLEPVRGRVREVSGKEQEDKGLRVVLLRCAKAEEENGKFKEALESRKAAEVLVDEFRIALEHSAIANAVGEEERTMLTETIEQEKQATQEATSRAVIAENLFQVAFEQNANSETLRLEELKKFKEASERERRSTQEATSRAIVAEFRALAAEELIDELRFALERSAISIGVGQEERTRITEIINGATCMALAAKNKAVAAEKLVVELRTALQHSGVERARMAETIEKEKQLTLEATRVALIAEDRAVAAEKLVDELRLALEHSAMERTRMAETVELEKRATQEATSRAVLADSLLELALEQKANLETSRLEELKNSKEASEIQEQSIEEARCRAAAAEMLVGELRGELAKAQGKLSQLVKTNYVVKQEPCPMR